ncbi:hypothetical protein Hypma_004840 [Hypsizygus marmoreus]|uniref:Uncharacterized protein n=1 Tax=Hypsizygus marmoreus TaxID=39966 RepID=A0A369J6Z2_HYPMA|nr:hypothetical protein Hypma_004840 [Hypsizygus marmoreus]
MTTLADRVTALSAAITKKPPYCTGTLPLGIDEGIIFYRHGKTGSWIDLPQATDADLKALVQACEPATFGMDRRDVLDDSYRKAWKLDKSNFAPKFDVTESSLMDRVRAQLMASPADETRSIKAELYKLNVYGKDSFFKSHKDTPRSDVMFGSLVVVFPTQHEGGSLILRHKGEEWTFNSTDVLRGQDEISIAYIAFYSDVDHEVTVVSSGYRVTLTYNLLFGSRPQLPASITPIAPEDRTFEAALTAALDDPSFLPEGGDLGFGLSFLYPVMANNRSLSTVKKGLKGSDAVIHRVCSQLSLDASLKVIYDHGYKIMTDYIAGLDNEDQIEDISEYLRRDCEGSFIYDYGKAIPEDDEDAIEILWVTPLTAYSHFKSSYIAYGNEASLGSIYADLCIVVEIGPYGERETA